MEITEDNPAVRLIAECDDISIDKAIEQVQQVTDYVYNTIINGPGDPNYIVQSGFNLGLNYIFDILGI